MPTEPLTESLPGGARPDAEPPQGPPRTAVALPWQGAVAGVAAAVAYFIGCALTLVVIMATGAASDLAESAGGLGSPLGSAAEDVPQRALSLLPAAAAQLGAMGLLGTVEGQASLGLLGQWSMASFGIPSGLTLMAGALVVFAAWLQRFLAPLSDVRKRLAQALALGGGFAAGTTIAAAALPLQFDEMGITARASAGGFVPFLAALVLGSAAAWLGFGLPGRWGARNAADVSPAIRLSPAAARVLAVVRPGLWTIAAHALVFLLVALPAAWIVGGVQGGWPTTVSAILWLGHALALAFAVGHLAGASAESSVPGGGSNVLYHLFAADQGAPPAAAWLLVVLALVAVVVSGTVLAVARGERRRDWASAWVSPAVFALAALLAAGFFHASTRITAAFFMGSGTIEASVGAPWWLAFVTAGWGLLAEVVSRTVAPYLLGLLPERHLARAAALVAPPAVPAVTTATAPVAPSEASPSSAAAVVAATDDAGPAPSAAHSPVEVRTLSPRGRKRLAAAVVAVAGAGALVAVAAIVLAVVRAGNGPEATVRAYLDDVIAGRAQEAVEEVSPNVPNDARALLADEVYQKASGRIDTYSVVSTQTRGDAALVEVELGQDGRTQRHTFTVSKREPGLLDDNWTVDSGSLVRPITVSVNVKNPQLLVNGVAVQAAPSEVRVSSGAWGSGSEATKRPDGWPSDRATTATFYALPGVYTVGLGQQSPLIEAAEESVPLTIGAQAPASAQLQARPSEAFRDQLDASVTALVDRCLARTALSPSIVDRECPFSRMGWSGYDYRNVRWTLTRPATYEVGGRAYSDGAIQVRPKASGTAEVSYERKSTSVYAKDEPYRGESESDSFELEGVALVKDGKVEFQYVPYGNYVPR